MELMFTNTLQVSLKLQTSLFLVRDIWCSKKIPSVCIKQKWCKTTYGSISWHLLLQNTDFPKGQILCTVNCAQNNYNEDGANRHICVVWPSTALWRCYRWPFRIILRVSKKYVSLHYMLILQNWNLLTFSAILTNKCVCIRTGRSRYLY